MQKAIAVALIAVGGVLLILGYDASQSFSSKMALSVTGWSGDRAMWLPGGSVSAAGMFRLSVCNT